MGIGYNKPQVDTLLGAKLATAAAPELIRDTIAALFANGSQTGISFAFNDSADKVDVVVTASGGGSGSTTLPFFNATDYGISSADADCGPEINALITTVAATGGGVITFPSGSQFNIGTSVVLKGGVYLVSLAPNHGYIAASPSKQSVKFNATSGLTGAIISSEVGWSMGVQGIDVSGNGNCDGIVLSGVYWGAVKQSMANGCLRGFAQVAPAGGGSAGFACVWEDLMTTNCVSASVTAETGALDLDGTDHYISRIEATSGSQNNLLKNASKYCAAAVIRGSNHFVDACVFETSDVGLVVRCTNSRFANVRADTNNGDGFHIYTGGNTFVGCTAIGNSQAATGVHTDWIVDANAWGNSWASCTSQTAGSKKPKYGFWDMCGGPGGFYASKYVGCSVQDSADVKWYIQGTAGVQFPPVTLKPALSTTLAVEQTSGFIDLSNYNAATTITSILGSCPGQSVRLVGNANVTFANNASVVTSTGAAVTLVANKLYTLDYFGGVWYLR